MIVFGSENLFAAVIHKNTSGNIRLIFKGIVQIVIVILALRDRITDIDRTDPQPGDNILIHGFQSGKIDRIFSSSAPPHPC